MVSRADTLIASLALACMLAVPTGALAASVADETAGSQREAPATTAGEADSEHAPSSRSSPRNPDPWEPFNRVIFQLNEWGDIYILKPMSLGWRFLTPSPFRDMVTNFNTNLQMPVVFGNNVLQLKPVHARDDLLRMIFNLSFGLGGLIDMGTLIDIPQNDEEFGQTLGYWGVPSGPYLVLPVFGPSTVRDGVGRAADAAGTFYFSFLPFYSTLLTQCVEVVNLRSFYIEEIDANRAESFDYYVFLRNAYLQNRRVKVDSRRSGGDDQRPEESLYDFEDDVDEDFDEDFDD